MKTKQDIENLKRQWLNDPCWDIEDTEGFEDYKKELLEYRLSIETEKRIVEEKRKSRACALYNCNLEMLRTIESLQHRVEVLEKEMRNEDVKTR